MKKRTYVYLSILCALLIAVFALLSFRASNKVATVAEAHRAKPTIILDAGHGGEDGGAVSPSGLVEKDVNLDVALKLQKLFLQSGFDVIMTRTSDTSIHDNTAATTREKKVSDLNNRVRITNTSEQNVLISIHQNMFEQSKYNGTQVFYSVNSSDSTKLAECIKTAVKGLIQNNNERECKPATSSIYLLDKAQVPSVLVECGFLSNPEEEKLLMTDEYRSNMAFCIYSGFLEFYYQNY